MKIPPEFADILHGAEDQEMLSDAPTDTEEVSDVPIVLDKMFADAERAVSLNMGTSGARLVHNLEIASTERSATTAAIYKGIAERVTKKKPVTAGGDDELAKTLSPEGRRKSTLREFLKSKLAEGDSAESVIAYAQRYDAHTANLLRAVAAELGV